MEDEDTFDSGIPSIPHTTSVRERILSDPEASVTAISMVRNAREKLHKDWHYKTYRKLLEGRCGKYVRAAREREREEQGLQSNDIVIEDILSRMMGEETPEERDFSKSHLIDIWMDELLKFLAMKVLIDDNKPAPKSPVETSRYEGKDYSQRDRLHLIPSEAVHDAWKNLLLLPITYGEICTALGSEFIIDFIDIDDDELDQKLATRRASHTLPRDHEKRLWLLECYRWTYDSYWTLYNDRPPALFWPKNQIESGSRKRSLADSNSFSFSSKLNDMSKTFVEVASCGEMQGCECKPIDYNQQVDDSGETAFL